MAKRELVVAAVVTDQQSLPAQRFDRAVQLFAAGHVLQLAKLESLPDDACRLKDVLFVIGKSIESSRKDGVDTLGYADLVDRTGRAPAHPLVDHVPFIDQHMDELFA